MLLVSSSTRPLPSRMSVALGLVSWVPRRTLRLSKHISFTRPSAGWTRRRPNPSCFSFNTDQFLFGLLGGGGLRLKMEEKTKSISPTRSKLSVVDVHSRLQTHFLLSESWFLSSQLRPPSKWFQVISADRRVRFKPLWSAGQWHPNDSVVFGTQREPSWREPS